MEELREKADALIAAIDQGETVTITRDGKQIATTNPEAPAGPRGHRGAMYPFRDFDWGPRPKNLKPDPAELIIEERERERSEKKWRS